MKGLFGGNELIYRDAHCVEGANEKKVDGATNVHEDSCDLNAQNSRLDYYWISTWYDCHCRVVGLRKLDFLVEPLHLCSNFS